ncbi:MAG: hypothetical protein ACOYL5_07425 [Phototrophicaceae bacterium]|jgi:hypothetical protein
MTAHARLWLAVIGLLAALSVAAAGLHADAIWYDEWWSLHYSGHDTPAAPISLVATLERVANTDHELNPPGYYVLLNLWGQAVGRDAGMLRALSWLVGALALAAVARLGGIGALALMGASAFWVYYLHEARAYMLMVAAVGWLLVCYQRAMAHPHRRWGAQAGIALSSGVLVYTHYMGVFVLVALGVVHLFTWRGRSRQGYVVLATLTLGAGSLLAWAGVAFNALQTVDGSSSRAIYARPALELALRTLDRFSNGQAALYGVLAVVGMMGVLTQFTVGAQYIAPLHTASIAPLQSRPRLLWLWVGLLSFGLAALANAAVGFVTDVHYLLALWPLLAVVGGLGVAALPRRVAQVAVCLWIVAGVGRLSNPLQPDPIAWQLYAPYDQIKALLAPLAAQGDPLLFYLPARDPAWIHREVADYYLSDLGIQTRLIETLLDSPLTPDESLSQALQDRPPYAWVIWEDHNESLMILMNRRSTLASLGYTVCDGVEYSVGGISQWMIARAPADDAPSATFGDGQVRVRLANITPIDGQLRAIVWIEQAEQAPLLPANTYSVALHGDNATGDFITQADFGLPAQPSSCALATLPTANGVPSVLRAVIYQWANGERLPADADDGRLIFHLPVPQ